MKMPLSIFPQHIKEQYDLDNKAYQGHVWLEIRKAIYGLPQAGILANKQLRTRLAKHGYFEVNHTPGLWRHVTRPVQFSLVVDDFGVKYVGEENAQHLINAIQTEGYKLSIDWSGTKYCGITLQWDWEMRTLTIPMPGYVQKMLARFKHELPPRNQYSSYQPQPKKYGKNEDDTIPVDNSPLLDEKRKRVVQQVIGTCLYYARAVDCTILPAISSIASTQAKATEETERRVKQLLDYLATLPNAKVRFYASK